MPEYSGAAHINLVNVSNKLEINLVLLTINNSVFESEKNTIVQILEVISDIAFASHGK